MTPSKTISFVAVLITALAIPPIKADQANPIKTTLCSISTDQASFSGKVVMISSQLNSDGMHGSWLTDSQCPNYGVTVSVVRPFKGESAYRKALQTGKPGTLDKTISGTFIGRFIWQPDKFPQSPQRVLVLREVHDISVERLPVKH